MTQHAIETLALDLEGTLVSNAVSQFPRPELYEFLEFCRASFPRLVIFTTVEERIFRRVAAQLIAEAVAPAWFGDLPHVRHVAEYKDLALVPGASVARSLLVDDMPQMVHPDQRSQYVQIAGFDGREAELDRELQRVMEVLAARQALN